MTLEDRSGRAQWSRCAARQVRKSTSETRTNASMRCAMRNFLSIQRRTVRVERPCTRRSLRWCRNSVISIDRLFSPLALSALTKVCGGGDVAIGYSTGHLSDFKSERRCRGSVARILPAESRRSSLMRPFGLGCSPSKSSECQAQLAVRLRKEKCISFPNWERGKRAPQPLHRMQGTR
jgi:hypothetical protein